MDEPQEDDLDFKKSRMYEESSSLIDAICEKTPDFDPKEVEQFYYAFRNAGIAYDEASDTIQGKGTSVPSSFEPERTRDMALGVMVSLVRNVLGRTNGNPFVILLAWDFLEIRSMNKGVFFEAELLQALREQIGCPMPDLMSLSELRKKLPLIKVPKETPVEVVAFETKLATYPAMLRRAREKFSEKSMEFAEILADTGPSAIFVATIPLSKREHDDWDALEEPLYKQLLEDAVDAVSVLSLMLDEIRSFVPTLTDEDLRKKYEPLLKLAHDVKSELNGCSSMRIEGRNTGSLNISREEKIKAMREFLNRHTQPMIKAIQEILPSVPQ